MSVLQCVKTLHLCVCCSALPTCDVSVCVTMHYQPVMCLCVLPTCNVSVCVAMRYQPVLCLCVSPCITNLCIALCVLQ